jgi:hypothetical protein
MLEILILRHLTAVVSHYPLSPGPSVSQVETEETPEKLEGDPDDPEPAAEADIQMEFSSA